jgi:hypothetical protein
MLSTLGQPSQRIARRRGSVPEVVEHGVTGLIGETDQYLTRACGDLDILDHATCRAIAERRFGPAVMTDAICRRPRVA